MTLRHVNTEELGKPKGYTNAIQCPPGASVVLFAGQTARGADQRIVEGGMAKQWDQTLTNILAVVREVGGRPANISSMRVYVTGGAGFISGAVCRTLRARGDEVVAVVRDPEHADRLRAIGCEVRGGDLSSPEVLTGGMRDCDGVIHLAGMYRIGIAARERSATLEVPEDHRAWPFVSMERAAAGATTS